MPQLSGNEPILGLNTVITNTVPQQKNPQSILQSQYHASRIGIEHMIQHSTICHYHAYIMQPYNHENLQQTMSEPAKQSYIITSCCSHLHSLLYQDFTIDTRLVTHTSHVCMRPIYRSACVCAQISPQQPTYASENVKLELASWIPFYFGC